MKVKSLNRVQLLVLQKSSKILLGISLEGKLGPHSHVPTASPFSLHPRSSLTIDCLNCALELRKGHGGRMKPVSYKQEMGDTERLLYRGVPQGPAQLQYLDCKIVLPFPCRLLEAKLVVSHLVS